MQILRGTIKGQTIILKEAPSLPDEAEVLVTLQPMKTVSMEEIQEREIAWLTEGFDMGALLHKRREELYER